jgi:predicted nucleic acid-binding protein
MAIERRRSFPDTNVLVYALDPEAGQKRKIVETLLLEAMRERRLIVSPQTLNELYRVLADKRRIPREEAKSFVRIFVPHCTALLDAGTVEIAWSVQDRTGFGWYDCVLLAAAIRSECEVFLSEDLQHGRVVDGLTIENPFAAAATRN